MKLRNRQSGGFTLTELLIVMGIIALLLSILLPSLTKARRSAQQVGCGSNLRQLGLAFTMYADDYHGMYPTAEDPVIPAIKKWLWMGEGFRPVLEPYAVRGSSSPGVFFCPADLTSADIYAYTSYGYSLSFYHSPEQINSISGYGGQVGASGALPARPQKLTSVKYPSQKILCGEWLSVHYPLTTDAGWFGTEGKREFLFADGHVELVDALQIITANDSKPNPNVTRDGIKGFDVQ